MCKHSLPRCKSYIGPICHLQIITGGHIIKFYESIKSLIISSGLAEQRADSRRRFQAQEHE